MFAAITAQNTAANANQLTLTFVILMSFVRLTILAIVYQATYRGLPYSRNYVQSIVLIPIIAAMVIQSIGDSLARGL